jgi:hypothetical protein
MNEFARIVDDYIRDHQSNAERERRWFAIQPNLKTAIDMAALAKSPSGKRLSHQRRIPATVLERSRTALAARSSRIKKATSFEGLFQIVVEAIYPIPGIGELAVYDTALRIAAFLKLEPASVYLHAGTRVGAQRLGFDRARDTISRRDLPKEFRRLKASEIEDVLCIYADRLASDQPKAGRRRRAACGIAPPTKPC